MRSFWVSALVVALAAVGRAQVAHLDVCKSDVHAQSPLAAKTCEAAAVAAEKLPANDREDRRVAHVYAAYAYLQAHRTAEAMRHAELAVQLANDAAGSAAAYAVLGKAQAMGGNFSLADTTLATAEDWQKKAVAAASADSREVRVGELRDILVTRAKLLRADGDSTRASALEGEAAGLR